jgi:hypothetical protein
MASRTDRKRQRRQRRRTQVAITGSASNSAAIVDNQPRAVAPKENPQNDESAAEVASTWKHVFIERAVVFVLLVIGSLIFPPWVMRIRVNVAEDKNTPPIMRDLLQSAGQMTTEIDSAMLSSSEESPVEGKIKATLDWPYLTSEVHYWGWFLDPLSESKGSTTTTRSLNGPRLLLEWALFLVLVCLPIMEKPVGALKWIAHLK